MPLPKESDKWPAGNDLPVKLPKAEGCHNQAENVTEYRVVMQQIEHTFHPKLKRVPVWSYHKDGLGLILEARVGEAVRIAWVNGLVDKTLKGLLDFGSRLGMEEPHMLATSHNVVHLHGARVPWTSDGFPEHVYHPHESHVFYYPNKQAASMLWFHDHAMDVTRLNVYAGLYGAYLLRGEGEEGLPAKDFEIPLILQDKSFSDDGKKLHYEQQVKISDMNDSIDVTPEFIGKYPVVNGKIWPVTTLAPRIYRLRILNGANTRFFNLTLKPVSHRGKSLDFHVIGTEGGFLETIQATSSLLIAPGERVDVLLDLRGLSGKEFILSNDAPAPYSGDPKDLRFKYGPLDKRDFCSELLKITVGDDPGGTPARFPTKPPKRVDPLQRGGDNQPAQLPSPEDFPHFEKAIQNVPIETLEADLMTASGTKFKLRRFKLEEYQLEMITFTGIRAPTVQINGKSWKTADPVVTMQNALEVWEFINTTPDTHPMHIHLIQFQVMSRTWLVIEDDLPRQAQDLTEPKKASYADGFEQAVVEPFEQGWKDTVRCNPQQSTRVMAIFDGASGEYVYHCHILEHEDMGMMFKLNVEA